MGSRRRPRSPGFHHGTALFLLTLLALGAAGACTDILGIEDRTLTSSGTGAAGTGTGGKGGATTGGGGTGGSENTCMVDLDCAGSPYGEKCDPASHKCVECLPGPMDTCAAGLFCDVTRVCAIGCADDADCNPNGAAGLTCDTTTHQCKGCGAGSPCPAGTKCDVDNKACVPGCDQSADCPTSDWACCNKQCRNVTKDVQNCGACEDPCVPEQSTAWLCGDGICLYQHCLPGWDNCDNSIAKGNGCETDTQSDPHHCGDCKTDCTFPHAITGCSVGNCTITGCDDGFQNCDDALTNGCEVDTTKDAEHCGNCGTSCAAAFPNAAGICEMSACKLGDCKAGFGDCDGNPANGCEATTSNDAQNCGGCGAACALAHAAQKCEAGKCGVAGCDDGFDDCDGLPANGCEANLGSDAKHCGGCMTACAFPHAAAMCNGGACGMGACDAGYANCNGLVSDGCEANIATDEANCGGCGNLCASANGTGTCTNQVCSFTCLPGFGDCDQLAGNGCETNLTNTVDHCGTCAKICTAQAGGTPYCFASVCGESNCTPGKADCNGNPADGCETNITLPNDCGSCGHHCSSTNGTPSCNGSTCSIACNAGYGDCNGNVADGCEQPLNTNTHCTACGTACQRANAVTSCGTGACLIVGCNPGWADCNNNPSDGCEANLNTSLGNCGACGSACAPANAVGACMAGVCTIQTCNAGHGNCNGGVADGCETDLTSDALHCGACPNQCSFPNAGATCANSTCQMGACIGSFANCNGLSPDGCEANLQSNTLHCGTCATACASINGAATCSAGMCAINCNSGYGNCNGTFNDGCEESLDTLQSCGACGTACNLPHATESCGSGACQIVTCDPGFTNCDNNAANGCECGSGCPAGMCQGCGDSFCNMGGGETCLTCPTDCACPAVCGDGICSAPAEDCGNCFADCCQTGSGGTGGTTTTTTTSTTNSTGMGGMGGSTTSSTTSSSTGSCGPFMGVNCNGTTCGATGCCYPMGGPVCAPPPMCMMAAGVYYACDDASDCGAGNVCCHTAAGGSVCTLATSCLTPSVELCTTPSNGMTSCECTDGPTHMDPQKCCPASPAGKDIHYPTCTPIGTVCK